MESFRPQHEYLVAIDSDGCVFDTMELKHKECFIPEFIRVYGLQAVSKYARETAEFVHLYSRHRGINRFPGLVEQLRLLGQRPEVLARGVTVTVPRSVEAWVAGEKRLGEPALEAVVQAGDDPDLRRALAWSRAVNRSIAQMVENVPPFPMVRESLNRLSAVADLIVCSGTPKSALEAEWNEHGIADLVAEIHGQESGPKKEILKVATKYSSGKALMVGDAPGDQAAAAAHGVLFFPIFPGREEESWREFHEVGIKRFLSGTFAGEYQRRLIDEFERALPVEPTWQRR